MKKSYSRLLKILGLIAIPPALYLGSRKLTIEMNEYCLNKSSKIENTTHLNYLMENEKKVQDINGKTIKILYTSNPEERFNCFPALEKNTYYLTLDSVLQNNSSGVIIHEMNHIAKGDCDKRYPKFINNNFIEPRTAFYTFKRIWKSNH